MDSMPDFDTKGPGFDSRSLHILFNPNAPRPPGGRRPPGAEAGRRPAVAGAAAFSKKADVVFSYIHRESLMLICRGNLFRTKLGT